MTVSIQITSPPQSNLRKARRSSADKTSSKLLRSHTPSMLSSWLGVSAYASVCRCTRTAAKWLLFAHGRIAILHLFWCIFALGFLCNPQFDLEPDYIIRKPLVHRIQRYIRHREILSTFHTRVDNRSIRHFCILFTPKLPLPLQWSPPKSNTALPSPTPLNTPNCITIHLRVSPLLTCADKQMVQAKVL